MSQNCQLKLILTHKPPCRGIQGLLRWGMITVSKKLKTLLKDSKTRVAILTGAGISRESGVPTFRDKDGLWQKFKPEELASMDAFLANPDLVAGWYDHRREVVNKVEPNAGHRALAEMQNFYVTFSLITQNVDGLHARAGSKNILELHGNIMRSFCVDCGTFSSESHLQTLVEAKCEKCGGRLRPDVVWFGEMLPMDILKRAEEATRQCQLFLSIGTSGAVYPAAGLPLLAKEEGAYIVEINPQETEISRYMDEVLRGPSAEVLPQLLQFTRSS